jgi:hypothetical protein
MIDIVLAVVAICLFIAILLQIIYIRATFHTYDKEKYRIWGSATAPDTGGDASNSVKVYSLVVHPKHTKIANDVALLNPSLGIDIPDNIYVMCDGVPTSKDVRFSRGHWLAMNRNQGSNNILQDLISGRVRYLLLDNTVFVAHFQKDAVSNLREALGQNANVDKPVLQDQEFVLLTELDNSFVFANLKDSATCAEVSGMNVFKLHPSSGSSPQDIMRYIETSPADVPVVILGFSTG